MVCGLALVRDRDRDRDRGPLALQPLSLAAAAAHFAPRPSGLERDQMDRRAIKIAASARPGRPGVLAGDL
jgi:hypothetical protein